MKIQNDYLKLARLMMQENALRKQMQAIQNKRLNGKGRFTCCEWIDNGCVLQVPLAELTAIFPEPKSELIKWTRETGEVMAYHRFGPEHVGEVKPGFHLWLKHETKCTEVVASPVPASTLEVVAA